MATPTPSFSDLPRETLAAIVRYLSVSEKQLLARTRCPSWITAIQDEMRAISIDESTTDVNEALDFVLQCCPNLEHFSLKFHVEQDESDVDFGGQWFMESEESMLSMDGEKLASAVGRLPLKSFRLHFGRGIRFAVFAFLRQAGGLNFLMTTPGLQVLDCNYLDLASMEQIANVLNFQRESLVEVKLDNLTFLEDSPHWPEPHALMYSLANLPHLQQLSLFYHQLEDNDIAILLSGENAKHLKSLNLNSDFTHKYLTQMPTADNAGLTNKTLNIVAQVCLSLQHLDVSGNPGITSMGVRRILGCCPKLVELDASQCRVQLMEWKEICNAVEIPPMLLAVAFNTGFSPPWIDDHSVQQEITAAIAACQGQVLFCETTRLGIIRVDESEVEPDIVERQRASANLIRKRIENQKRSNDRDVPEYYWNRLSVLTEEELGQSGVEF